MLPLLRPAAFVFFALAAAVQANNPVSLFQEGDTVAIIGGEDACVMQQNGYLEWALLRAGAGAGLKFRNLAFAGDTVFEQHRQINYPKVEEQLHQLDAKVVLIQFGQSESLSSTSTAADFAKAYGALLDRVSTPGRRIALLSPTPFDQAAFRGDAPARNKALAGYVEAARALAGERKILFVDLIKPFANQSGYTRDGMHLNDKGHGAAAQHIAKALIQTELETAPTIPLDDLRKAIIAKNTLWTNYSRPHNWAFLNGDRTEQPSSRDHVDRNKRWFPEEMQRYLPLIAAKEAEIVRLATPQP